MSCGPGWALVEFLGGHLDGARMTVPADAGGTPAAQVVVLSAPGGPAAVYRRHAWVVDGRPVAWRMVHAG